MNKELEIARRDYDCMTAFYENDLKDRDKTIAELLDALEICANLLDCDGNLWTKEQQQQAFSAIAKAKGEL